MGAKMKFETVMIFDEFVVLEAPTDGPVATLIAATLRSSRPVRR
jgi:hypothetical protein